MLKPGLAFREPSTRCRSKLPRPLLLFASAVFLSLAGFAQQPTSDEDIVRVSTELAQIRVTVLDRNGRRVDGLSKDDFALTIDGKATPIDFFESIATGSQRDRRLRKGEGANTAAKPGPADSLPRTVIFFVDDHHLSLTSLDQTRATILDFLENRIGPDDQVAVASSSGRIGFLQQFTNNVDVLRAAVGRLSPVSFGSSDYGRNPGAPMTEYNALSIEQKDDPGIFDFYVQNCMAWGPKGVDPVSRRANREHCATEVRNRARQVLIQSSAVTAGTYTALERLIESASRMPGRKLAFFISDGFLPDSGPRGRIGRERIGEITSKARAASVVIYSVHARGLVSGSIDATGSIPMDPNGRLESAQSRAVTVSQEPLHALAADTGGRALRNQNKFDGFVRDAVDETQRFYLIAWLPSGVSTPTEKLRKVAVEVVGRSDLTVLLAESTPAKVVTSASVKTPAAATPQAELKSALADYLTGGEIPIELSLGYVDAPQTGPLLTTSVAIPATSLSFGENGNEPGQVTIAGVILDDNGKAFASFGTGLKVAPAGKDAKPEERSDVIYKYPSTVKPGIYQIRVAALDNRARSVGQANRWIVVPDLSGGNLTLSSLFFGSPGGSGQPPTAQALAAGEDLTIFGFVYNASRRNSSLPELEARTIVLRGKQEISSSAFSKIALDPTGDLARIGFTGRIKLDGTLPGSYVLRVIVRDRHTSKETSQQIGLTIR